MPSIYNDIPPRTQKKIVKMYQDGERVADIVAETGVSRPTIYWILRTEGVKPRRHVRDDVVTAAELAEMLRETEREIGRLQSELEHCRRKAES